LNDLPISLEFSQNPKFVQIKSDCENKEIMHLLANYYKQLGIYDPKVEAIVS